MGKRKPITSAEEIYRKLKEKDNPCNLSTSEFRNITPELVIMIQSGLTITAEQACKMANEWQNITRSAVKTRPDVWDFSAGYANAVLKKEKTPTPAKPKPPKLPKLPATKGKSEQDKKAKPKSTSAKKPAKKGAKVSTGKKAAGGKAGSVSAKNKAASKPKSKANSKASSKASAANAKRSKPASKPKAPKLPPKPPKLPPLPPVQGA